MDDRMLGFRWAGINIVSERNAHFVLKSSGQSRLCACTKKRGHYGRSRTGRFLFLLRSFRSVTFLGVPFHSYPTHHFRLSQRPCFLYQTKTPHTTLTLLLTYPPTMQSKIIVSFVLACMMALVSASPVPVEIAREALPEAEANPQMACPGGCW